MAIKMHFFIPAPKAPAQHMVSGEPSGALPLAMVLRQSIGHQGQGYVFACDPNLVTSETHRASGEPWALLELVDGIPAIGDFTCEECLKTDAWKAAYANNPHPAARKSNTNMNTDGGCC